MKEDAKAGGKVLAPKFLLHRGGGRTQRHIDEQYRDNGAWRRGDSRRYKKTKQFCGSFQVESDLNLTSLYCAVVGDQLL